MFVPNSYPSGQDLWRFTREFTPSFMPTLDDLAIDTIDNGLGMGNDSEWQNTASLKVINNDVVMNIILMIYLNNKNCFWISLVFSAWI